MKTGSLSFMLMLIVVSLYAQTPGIVLAGKVINKSTGEPIPYVTIIVPGTDQGTITDPSGNFQIQVGESAKTIRFSAVGYKKHELTVPSSPAVNLEISLAEENIGLQEIVVHPDNNPAIRIFRKLLQNKAFNDPYKLQPWSSKVYSKAEIDLKNFNPSASSKKIVAVI